METDKRLLSTVWPRVKSALSGKVDKVHGMGLSSNDYTTEEKEKLKEIAAIQDYEIDILFTGKEEC